YCLMHAQGDPRTMQANPRYGDVLLDVYDFLEAQVTAAEVAGIERSRIIVDPGIGFGKTLAHNMALIRGLSLFHALGCPVLLGASRKRFIGTLSGEVEASRRAPGSIAVGLWGLGQGVQMLRVHDVSETVQALKVWVAIGGEEP
ncbi:MAG: dihydropteroate synthase, partial [Pseudomonadota bacterium]